MSYILPIIILLTPLAYMLSPYAFVLLFLFEVFLFIKNVDGEGNRFLLLMLLTVMCSCISIAGLRLYDLVILIAFIKTWIRIRGHFVVSYNIFPLLAVVVIVGVLHSGSGNLTEMLRYIICFMLFITAFNNDYDFDQIKGKIAEISITNLYFAIVVFVLNGIGRISEYTGIVASNIYIYSSASELRMNGFFSDPNKYMAFCLAMMFIVEIWMQNGKLKNWTMVILCISSLISMSRTAILSLLAYLFFKVIKITLQKSWILTVILCGVIISAVVLFVFNPMILNSLLNYLFVTSSKLMGRELTLSVNMNFQSDNRILIWEQAIELIKKQPLIGYGWNSIREMLPYPTHNTVLELLMDSGIIGLLCYLFLMSKLLFNKYYEYTIPFVWIPMLLLDMGGYRVLFLLLGCMYWENHTYNYSNIMEDNE